MNPDILHAHYATANGLLGALTGFHPFVISVWGSDVMRVQQRSWASRYRTAYALRRADCITTTAMFMKGYLIKTFGLAGDRIVRVPWGIDLQVFHHGYEKEAADLRSSLGIEADAPVVLSNRHMVPLYNIDSIVSSIPCVLKSYPQTVFVLIRGYGTPEFENQMRLKTRKLGVESNVRIVPRAVTPHEMAIYLSMSNVFLSIPKTDQFGSSVMEGMACGSTPIVSNIEAYHQYLKDGENAFIVDAQSPEEIADKIVYCIGHPKIKDSFYAANKKIIEEKEDWSKNAKRMEELYKRLLESK
jgi:glycosyltransferase involved in cell wall biosynthesis